MSISKELRQAVSDMFFLNDHDPDVLYQGLLDTEDHEDTCLGFRVLKINMEKGTNYRTIPFDNAFSVRSAIMLLNSAAERSTEKNKALNNFSLRKNNSHPEAS